jgi:hypothetical protein
VNASVPVKSDIHDSPRVPERLARSGCRGRDLARRALGQTLFTGFTRFADLHSALCGGVPDAAGSGIDAAKIERPSAFALCRLLLPFAAACCTERTRKGQAQDRDEPRRLDASDQSVGAPLRAHLRTREW